MKKATVKYLLKASRYGMSLDQVIEEIRSGWDFIHPKSKDASECVLIASVGPPLEFRAAPGAFQLEDEHDEC